MSRTVPTSLLYRPPIAELRFLPEGPYPCGDHKFSWVAIQHGADDTYGSLNVFDLRFQSNESYSLPLRPGFAFACDREHHFVVGGDHRLGIYSTIDGTFQTLAEGIDEHVEGTIINDGVTWDGNLFFGCKDLAFRDAKAGLYLWRGHDRKLIQLRDDQTCSNGKVVLSHTSTSAVLLDIDTPTKSVVRYELNLTSGKLSPPTLVLNLQDLEAFPDGMILTPDRKSIVISFYNPKPVGFGETRQYRLEDGELERTWTTEGSPQATCPQWIVRNDKVCLIITTAVENMSLENQERCPQAGSLFIAETEYAHPTENPPFPIAVVTD